MRLLTRHIHRAFAELDPYGDEQCWRFIDAAQGTWVVRAMMVASAVAFGVVMTMAGVVAWAFTLQGLGAYDADRVGGAWWRWGLGLLAAVPLLGLGPVGGYFARDRLLGWRLRYILRRRGRCPQCGYTLIGLALSERSTVLCPECGAECEVDPSMGELTREGAATGRVLTKGTFVRPPVVPPWVWRWVKRSAMVLGILLFVVVPAVLGSWELAIRRDAARARADVPGLLAEMEAVVRGSGLKPAGATDGRVGTRRALDDARAVLGLVNEGWLDKHKGEESWTPSLAVIYEGGRSAGLTAEESAAQVALAREWFEACRAAGMDEKLAALARSVPERPEGPSPAMSGSGLFAGAGWFADSPFDEYLRVRAFDGERNGGRGLVPLIGLRLGLARVFCTSPMPMDKYDGLATELEAHRLMVNLLVEHPEPAVSAELRRVLEGSEFDARIADIEAVMRIQSLQTVGAWFQCVDEARWAGWSSLGRDVRRYAPGVPRMGWYEESRDFVRAWCSVPAEVWGQDPSVRSWIPPVRPSDPPMVGLWNVSDPSRPLAMADRERVERRGVRLLLAVEMFRAAAGRYPETLEELVPGQLAALPPDPWSGNAFRYKVVDPGKDRLGRGFLLYSVGADGVDDGGVEPKAPRSSYPGPVDPTPGVDWIVNLPR